MDFKISQFLGKNKKTVVLISLILLAGVTYKTSQYFVHKKLAEEAALKEQSRIATEHFKEVMKMMNAPKQANSVKTDKPIIDPMTGEPFVLEDDTEAIKTWHKLSKKQQEMIGN